MKMNYSLPRQTEGTATECDRVLSWKAGVLWNENKNLLERQTHETWPSESSDYLHYTTVPAELTSSGRPEGMRLISW